MNRLFLATIITVVVIGGAVAIYVNDAERDIVINPCCTATDTAEPQIIIQPCCSAPEQTDTTVGDIIITPCCWDAPPATGTP